MAGIALFGHAADENLTPPQLRRSSPCAVENNQAFRLFWLLNKNSLFKVLKRRTGLVLGCFVSQDRGGEREENHILPAFYGSVRVPPPLAKLNSPRPAPWVLI